MGLHTVGKGLMVAEGSLWEAAIIKLLPLCRKHPIKVRNQKGVVMFCHSSMCLTAAEGSLWEKADGELMLRHSMKSVNVVLCSRQKTYRSGQGREVERPDAAQITALCVPPPADRTGARKQKRSFLL